LGYNAYVPYAFQADQIRYYQTKSPFSEVTYNLGAGGQTNLNFAFARNVDSLWNVGVEIQRLVADKNLTDAAFKSGDQSLTGQWGVLLHTNFEISAIAYWVTSIILTKEQMTKGELN
jgi:hypothetical protein